MGAAGEDDDHEFTTTDLSHRDPDRFKRSTNKESGEQPTRTRRTVRDPGDDSNHDSDRGEQ